MSYVKIIAKRDDGLAVEFEIENPIMSDWSGKRTAVDIQRVADTAIAAITSKPVTHD